ncbi:MAG: glycine betaine ABC transporter substrate-binding protein [Pseudomonadota bacterium]
MHAESRRTVRLLMVLILVSCTFIIGSNAAYAEKVLVGSKTFAESHVLAEIAAQRLEAAGFEVELRHGLGGTLICYQALKTGELHLYPEYTGTLSQAVLKDPGLSLSELKQQLGKEGLALGSFLGFNNSYALALPTETARSLDIERISDLRQHPNLRFGFTHEFLNRGDGWPAIQNVYQLTQTPTGIGHALAYRALATGALDVTDAYTTDGELELYELTLLDDDLTFFPRYDAAFLTGAELPPGAWAALESLQGRIDESRMQSLNRKVAKEKMSPAVVARDFLRAEGLLDDESLSSLAESGPRLNSPKAGGISSSYRRGIPSTLSTITRHTATHLKLTLLALLLGCAVALPLAIAVSRSPGWARAVEYVTGIIQTIPALALLALLIPLFGLGQRTAIVALFLYSLLPIVRNTLAGLASLDPLLKDVAASLGMTPRQQLLKIELPLAMPTIFAGIKTAAVISIGTATLAAFVGAGGLGEPIMTGLSLNDHRLILQGAIPAACLALITEFLFGLLTLRIVPAHLR